MPSCPHPWCVHWCGRTILWNIPERVFSGCPKMERRPPSFLDSDPQELNVDPCIRCSRWLLETDGPIHVKVVITKRLRCPPNAYAPRSTSCPGAETCSSAPRVNTHAPGGCSRRQGSAGLSRFDPRPGRPLQRPTFLLRDLSVQCYIQTQKAVTRNTVLHSSHRKP